MSEHTPGPWGFMDDSQIGYKPTVCNEAGRTHQPGAHYVADVRGPGIEWGCPSVEGAANAHLIAAAPDLLEACEAILEELCGGCRYNARAPCTVLCASSGVTNILRAAIKKAEPNG